MILEWLGAAPVILAAVLVVFLPGMLSLAAAGMRGLALVAFAPVMTTAVASLAAIALSLLGIAWSAWSFAIVIVLITAIAWFVGRLLPLRGQQTQASTPHAWMLPTGLAIGMLISFSRIAFYISDPAAISQTNDAVFHLNALRYVQETGSASAFDLNAFIGASGFYPAAWHALASQVALVTGAGIPVVVNAVTIVIAAVVWPLGMAWLARTVSGSTTVAAYAAVLSSAMQLFPLLLVQWGVLYPNALSVALIPASVAVVVSLPSWSRAARPAGSIAQAGIFIAIALCALVFAQTSSVLVFGLISMIWFSWWMLAQTNRSMLVRWIAVIAGWLVLAAVWVAFSRSTGGSHWPPFRGKFEVWFDIVFNSQLRIPAAWGISVLMLIGLVVVALRARQRWLVAAWLALSALYVLAATFGIAIVRDGLLGPWYADPYRIAALAPIAVIPLAAVGFDAIVRAVIGRVRNKKSSATAIIAASLAILSLATVVVVAVRPVGMPDVIMNKFEEESLYRESATSYLSFDERKLLESLDQFVDDDATVIGNPSTGLAFGYFLSGVDVFPRTWSPPMTAQWQQIATGLRDVAADPAICEALAAYSNPEYVLDFGLGETYAGRYEVPGMTGFAGQEGFELITEVGDASLWRITACSH
ncbi:DUF6541 family protein [Microbacterium sp. A94]|uniref:DUF6541 family protein n=1 Tax=Microbacterium sp. A94 TaxID=3450717 RepID=UPI003F42FB72